MDRQTLYICLQQQKKKNEQARLAKAAKKQLKEKHNKDG